MLLMPQPASAAPSARTTPSAAMRRKPWPSMGMAPGSRRDRPLLNAHGAACGDRIVAAKGGEPPFLVATDLAPEHHPPLAHPGKGFMPATHRRVPQARAG